MNICACFPRDGDNERRMRKNVDVVTQMVVVVRRSHSDGELDDVRFPPFLRLWSTVTAVF